jgi:hypothetical protein
VNVKAQGISMTLVAGWDIRIGRIASGDPGAPANAIVHAANFALPEGRGDFGSGVVNSMQAGHLLVVLFEYGPASIGTALFERQGLPRSLRPEWFKPNQLQRTIAGQSGLQVFFTESGRPFTLYAVLGSHGNRMSLVPQINDLLETVAIERREAVSGP